MIFETLRLLQCFLSGLVWIRGIWLYEKTLQMCLNCFENSFSNWNDSISLEICFPFMAVNKKAGTITEQMEWLLDIIEQKHYSPEEKQKKDGREESAVITDSSGTVN